MIKNIEKYLYKELPLMLGDETGLGKTCHLVDKFKANIKSVKVDSYQDIFGYDDD